MGYEYWPESLAATIRRAWEVTGGNVPILVTENGIGTDDDDQRIDYVFQALQGVLRCLADGIDVRGYTYWSLLDNFEWAFGYGPRFGLTSVDRATFRRTPKLSATWLGQVARSNALVDPPEVVTDGRSVPAGHPVMSEPVDPSTSPLVARPASVRLLGSKELLKWVKYSCVSLVGVATTQVILSLPYTHWHMHTWHCTSVDANMFAVAISAMPAYLLNRAWVWGKQGKNSLTREVVPFWCFAFAGFLLSTLFVHVVEHHTNSTWAVRGANLAGFGLLWVVRFFVLDKLLFKTTKADEDTDQLAEDAPLA